MVRAPPARAPDTSRAPNGEPTGTETTPAGGARRTACSIASASARDGPSDEMMTPPAASKTAWAHVLSIRETPLLSDFWPHGKLAMDLEIFNEEAGFSARANILLDEEGKVIWAKQYPNSELPDMEEVLRAIAEN